MPRPTQEIKSGIVPNHRRQGLNIFSSSDAVTYVFKKTNPQLTSRGNQGHKSIPSREQREKVGFQLGDRQSQMEARKNWSFAGV